MNSTNVPSKNKTEAVGMKLSFNIREKEYEIVAGNTLDSIIADHIQEQGEIGISLEESEVNSNNQIEKQDGTTIAMINPQAFIAIAKHKAIIDKQNEEIAKIYKGEKAKVGSELVD